MIQLKNVINTNGEGTKITSNLYFLFIVYDFTDVITQELAEVELFHIFVQIYERWSIQPTKDAMPDIDEGYECWSHSSTASLHGISVNCPNSLFFEI